MKAVQYCSTFRGRKSQNVGWIDSLIPNGGSWVSVGRAGLTFVTLTNRLSILGEHGATRHYWATLKLSSEPADDYSDDRAANSAHADDRPVGFCDDRVWDAQ
jgi:hypothetical protein